MSSPIKAYLSTDSGPSSPLSITGEVDGVNHRLHVDATISGQPLSISLDSLYSENLTIYNVNAAVSGTEYSQVLSSNTKKILIRARQNAKLQVAFAAGTTGTNYISVELGASLTIGDLLLTGKTIYFQANKTSVDVEILEWS